MPKRGTPYQYQATDSPLTVASQFNLQPNQLISANPGGYPFTTGQTINIPNFMSPGAPNPYQAAINAQPAQTSFQPANAPRQYQPYVQNALPNGQQGGRNLATPPAAGNAYSYMQGGSTPGQLTVNRRGGSNDAAAMFQLTQLASTNPAALSTEQQQQVMDYLNQRAGNPSGTTTNAAGTGSDEFMNTKFMQENAANGTAFENQLRWDPDRKKYVKIGKLINEGRLDPRDRNARLKKRKRGGGGGGGGGGNAAQVREDPNGRLAGVGLVNFNIGSG